MDNATIEVVVTGTRHYEAAPAGDVMIVLGIMFAIITIFGCLTFKVEKSSFPYWLRGISHLAIILGSIFVFLASIDFFVGRSV